MMQESKKEKEVVSKCFVCLCRAQTEIRLMRFRSGQRYVIMSLFVEEKSPQASVPRSNLER